jgi:hypothetical protein
MALNRLKYSACIFLFLATMLLLAHDALPHHHHGNIACFFGGHCHEHDSGHTDGTTSQHHRETPADSEGCLLGHLTFTHRLGSGAEDDPQGCLHNITRCSGDLTSDHTSPSLCPDSQAMILPVKEPILLCGAPIFSCGLRAPPVNWFCLC